MATRYETFTGKIAWANHLFNLDSRFGEEKWAVDLYISGEDLKKWKELGIQLKPIKEDYKLFPEDGAEGFKVKRRKTQRINGSMQEFEAPEVVDADDKPWNQEKGMIGNGTVAEITLQVYDTAMGVGNRLQKVKILELVPYEGSTKVEGSTKTSVSPTAKRPW